MQRLAVRERRGRQGDEDARAGALKQPALENVLLQSPNDPADEPRLQLRDLRRRAALAVQKDVTTSRDPPRRGRRRAHLARRPFGARPVHDQRRPGQGEGQGRADPGRRRRRPGREPGVSIREVGVASANYELGRTFNKDFGNAERLTIPITLLILLASFGSLVAAGLPVLLAFSAVLASLGLFAALTHVYAATTSRPPRRSC